METYYAPSSACGTGTVRLNTVKQCEDAKRRRNTWRLALDRSITWTEPDALTADAFTRAVGGRIMW